MILLISANFPPEPVAAAGLSYDLAMALSKSHTVTVISPRPTRPYGFAFPSRQTGGSPFEHIMVNSFTCPRSRLFGRMRESYSFGKHAVCFVRKRYQEIQCIYVSVWPLFAQFLIIKAAMKFKIPTIVHVQDVYPESLINKLQFGKRLIRQLLKPMDRFILHHADQVVANSEGMCNIFLKDRGLPPWKVQVVRNWQDDSKFHPNAGSYKTHKVEDYQKARFIFMYLGNIGPVAGVEFLIQSFAKAGFNKAELVIAGSGSQKDKCEQLAERYGNHNIRFTEVPPGMVGEIQSTADVMLLPVIKGASRSSVPSKLPAYMFSCKPVIACVEKDSDVAIAINRSECGIVVPPDDANSLIGALEKMMSYSSDTLFRYGKNGYDFAVENYSKSKNLEKLTAIILQLIA